MLYWTKIYMKANISDFGMAKKIFGKDILEANTRNIVGRQKACLILPLNSSYDLFYFY